MSTNNIERPKIILNINLQKMLIHLVNFLFRIHPRSLTPENINFLQAYLEEIKYENNRPDIIKNITDKELSYMQIYLEQEKINKIRQMAVQNNQKKCISVGQNLPDDPYNNNKKVRGFNKYADKQIVHNPQSSHAMANQGQNFVNPYEYGGRQNEFGSLVKTTYTGPYTLSRDMTDVPIGFSASNCGFDPFPPRGDFLSDIGLDSGLYSEQFPGAIRNVNVESVLVQREMTKTPGQRILTSKEINRFELLPFDPQDTRHIIWKDNMPRGGYPTRVDRLEQI